MTLGPDGKPVQEWDALNAFFTRHNKILLDKTAMEVEGKRLNQAPCDGQDVWRCFWIAHSLIRDRAPDLAICGCSVCGMSVLLLYN